MAYSSLLIVRLLLPTLEHHLTTSSVYLVHWPIIVFYRQYFQAYPSLLQLFGLFVVTLVLAGLLNRYVERRFRLSRGSAATGSASTGDGMLARTALSYTGGAVLLIVIVCGTLVAANGWRSRFSPAVLALARTDLQIDRSARKHYLEQTCTPAGEIFCGKRIPGKKTIFLLADSRGTDIYIALREAYPQANVIVSYAVSCPPTFSSVTDNQRFFEQCPEFNQTRLLEALSAPEEEVIFLAADLSTRTEEAMFDTVRRLRAAGKTVFLLGEFQITRYKRPIDIAIGALMFRDENYLERFIVDEPFRLDGDYAAKINALGAVYVSNKSFFFDGRYHLHDRQTGNLLTQDGVHLSDSGAKKFGQYLRDNYPLP